MSAPRPGPAPTGAEPSWTEALDALEDHVSGVEAALADATGGCWVAEGTPAWTVPAAALPPALAERARALLGRSQAAAGAVHRALAGVRRQQVAAAAADQRPPARSVYLDTAL